MAKKITIGICGAKGSFSEAAAKQYVKKMEIGAHDIVYLITAEAVLNAVQHGEVDKGVFPIENSNGGIVIEAVYAMAAHIFTIEKMFEIDVQHTLLVYPGKTAESIRTVSSHDQAIKQCRMYLKRKWPSVDIKEYPDTAQAAKDLSVGILPKTVAIIAPALCAKLYGLDILEEGIQDLKFNYTSFLAVTKRVEK